MQMVGDVQHSLEIFHLQFIIIGGILVKTTYRRKRTGECSARRDIDWKGKNMERQQESGGKRGAFYHFGGKISGAGVE